MNKYKCEICNEVIELASLDDINSCPKCGVDKSFLKEYIEEKDEYEPITGPIPISKDNPGIARIEEKCIKCGLCSKICQDKVGIHYNPKKAQEPVCLSCGQCILNCPVGALVPKYCYKTVTNYIKDTDKVVIAFTSPAVRVALGEVFASPTTNVEGKMVAALKRLGFTYVFDTSFGADLTIMEEASELAKRIDTNTNLPQFTSCCPAWVKYIETYHPKLIKNLSTCKSPIGMQGAMIKTYFSKMMNIDPENIISVAVTPCTAKKSEIKRDDNKDIDFVITTSELALMIREQEIDFNNLRDEEFDSIMGRGSGGGIIFGSSGGVMESAIRTYAYLKNGENPDASLLNYTPVRGYANVKEAHLKVNDKTLNLLVIHGLTHVEEILREIEDGKTKYDFIEVMNCPGGCVGGGGQPLGITSKQQEINEIRAAGLYDEDSKLKIRHSYENPDIIDIYQSYLDFPLSHRSEKLLHTKYQDKSGILGE